MMESHQFSRLIQVNFISLFFTICMSGCYKDYKGDLKNQIEDLYGYKVDLCLDSMKVFMPTQCAPCGYRGDTRFSIVSFIDTASCSPCAMQNLLGWCDFADSLDTYDGEVAVYFIFDPSDDMLEKSIQEAEYIAEDLDLPIYLDTSHVFSRTNEKMKLPKNIHTFVLDENKKVCLVGNLTDNSDLEKLFWDIINE